MFFPSRADFTVASPVAQLAVIQRFDQLGVDLRLQLLGESLKSFEGLRGEEACLLETKTPPDDGGKGQVEPVSVVIGCLGLLLGS